MFKKFINTIRNIFVSPEKKLEMETRKLAVQTTNDLDNLLGIIKKGEYIIHDYQKVENDREQFLYDNVNTQIDQNVSKNTKNKQAYMLLTGAMLIGCILSIKGLKFFFGELYASISMLMIIPIAMMLAGLIVVGSIYLYNFSNLFRDTDPFVFYLLRTAAYVIVLFIPTMNLLEGFDSNYRPIVMALNLLGCVTDITLHTSLVSMSSVYATAMDSKEAIKTMRLKDKALTIAGQKVRTFNDTFIKAKAIFTASAKQFISNFKELQVNDTEAALRALLLLDNFTIWLLNNKVMQHALIPYHADENGHPVVELKYFTPEQDSIRDGYDKFSTVRVGDTNSQQSKMLNTQNQITELQLRNTTAQQLEQVLDEDIMVQEPIHELPQSNPDDYNTMLDNINHNDKVL